MDRYRCPVCHRIVDQSPEGWLDDHTTTGKWSDDLCPGSGVSPERPHTKKATRGKVDEDD